jgi:hypothetical protein
MADLLAACSLLLTVFTILYSLWYAEILDASKRNIDLHAANRVDDYNECRRVFLSKTLPLAVGSITLFLLNLPVAYDILSYAVRQITETPRARYDAVQATFVAVAATLGLLATHTLVAAIGLGKHVRKLNPKRGDY